MDYPEHSDNLEDLDYPEDSKNQDDLNILEELNIREDLDIPHVSEQSKDAKREQDGNSLACEPKKLLKTKSELISSNGLQFIRTKLKECWDFEYHSTPANGFNTNANARKTVVELEMKKTTSRNTAHCITRELEMKCNMDKEKLENQART